MERPLPQAPAIAASEAFFLVRYAEASGFRLEPLLDRFGLQLSQLLESDGWIPLDAYLPLRETAAREWGDPFLGLHMAERARLADHGTLGYVLLNAPTVRDALEDLIRYIHVVKQGVEISLQERADRCLLTYRLTEPTITERRQDAEGSITLGAAMLRELVGEHGCVDEIHFEHPEPEDASELHRFFEAPLHFGRPVNAIAFPCPYLEREVVEADPQLYAVLRNHADAVLQGLRPRKDEADLVAQVGERVLKAIRHGDPRVSEVAQALAMSERTLQRRLSELGTNFARIVEETRHRLSLEYLRDPNLPLTEIAFLLGYSELSAFHRAFRRWRGVTPQQHRRSLA